MKGGKVDDRYGKAEEGVGEKKEAVDSDSIATVSSKDASEGGKMKEPDSLGGTARTSSLTELFSLFPSPSSRTT